MAESPNGVIKNQFVTISEVQIGERDKPDFQKVQDLMESISEVGLLNPITVDTNYRLIAGHHRLLACKELGHETIRASVVDLDGADFELAEIDENLIRREFSRLERAELLKRRKELFEAKYPPSSRSTTAPPVDPAQSVFEGMEPPAPTPSFYEDVAEKLGVRPRTVERDVQIAENTTEAARDIIRHTPVADNKDELLALSRIEPDEQEEVAKDLASGDPKRVRSAHGRLAPLMSSASPEWYTPTEIISRVIRVMGAIDLDPCSNSHENPNVPATKHYTAEDDGLSLEWHGRIYMNPPYGRSISDWADKLYEEYQAGRVTQAIALVPARTDTAWFRRFREFPRCFVSGRLKFSEHSNSAPFPSAVIALGCNLDDFTEAFAEIGDVYQLVVAEVKADLFSSEF